MPWRSQPDVEALLDAVQLGVVVHNVDSTVMAANARALELLRVTREESLGAHASEPVFSLVDERGDPLPQERYPVNLVLRTGEAISSYTIGIAHADGSPTTWVSCNAYERPLDGRVVVTFVDVSAELEANAALKRALAEAEESRREASQAASRLEVALSAMKARTFEFDIGAESIAFDEDFSEVLGYPPGELTSLSLSRLRELTHEDDLPGRVAAMRSIMCGESDTYSNEARLRHRDGRWVWVENRGKVLRRDEAGRPTHMVGVLVDITVRRELERTLLHHQKMEALGTLSGGIAHDFNNLLAPILGYAELLRQSLPAGGVEAEYLGNVERSAERARELVEKILLISRASSFDKQPVSLLEMVEEVLVVIGASAPRDLVIERFFEPSLPNVLADPAKIYQVLLNLCTNATQAMGEGGTLTLRLAHAPTAPDIPSDERCREGYVAVTVEDSGRGMDAETLTRIFDPFFTTRTKDERRGTGLGLSIVASVVREHGGVVKTRSEPGGGTVFTVYLPATQLALEKEPLQPEEAQPAPSAHVLFVEDESAVRTLGVTMLRSLGYRVSDFADGRGALAAFSAEPEAYDLVLTDYEMPELAGSLLAQRIKAIREDVPVVLVTGYSHLAAKDSEARLAVDRVLAKPYRRSALEAVIRDTLGSETAR